MTLQKFKLDNFGETQVTILDGPYKGYKIIMRSMIINVEFNNKFFPDGKKPDFDILHSDTFIVIPPEVNLKATMK